MIRRSLAVLLALSLVLGWTGAIASAGCGAGTGKAAATLSVLPGGCDTCEDDEGKGQTRQGCAVLNCAAGCVSGPATAATFMPRFGGAIASEKTAAAPNDALTARAIPPDHPPPR